MEIIGVDAGATWVKAARLTSDLEIIKETKIRSGAAQGVSAYFDSVAAAVKECGGQSENIGLSIPGTFTKDGSQIKYACNIQGLGFNDTGVDWRDEILKRIQADKIIAENDAKCAAVGEWAKGSGEGDKNKTLLHVTWGTGLGTGLVSNGVPMYGWEGGHLPVSFIGETGDNQTTCNCGSTRDLEAHISVSALLRRARSRLASGQFKTVLTSSDLADDYHAPILLCQLSETGDGLARSVMVEALEYLAQGLHMMSVLVYPDLVTIGGAMMDRDYLLAELRRVAVIEKQGYLSDSLPPTIIHRAKLGNKAGVLGAAWLARETTGKFPYRRLSLN